MTMCKIVYADNIHTLDDDLKNSIENIFGFRYLFFFLFLFGFFFQSDNASAHIARWFPGNYVPFIIWPSQSRELNIIQQLWHLLRGRIHIDQSLDIGRSKVCTMTGTYHCIVLLHVWWALCNKLEDSLQDDDVCFCIDVICAHNIATHSMHHLHQ